MPFELLFIRKPKHQPILAEPIAAATVDEAKALAKLRLEEMALKIAPPPDAVIVIEAETREMLDVIER